MWIYLVLLITSSYAKIPSPILLNITETAPSTNFTSNFDSNKNSNMYAAQLTNITIKPATFLFVALESKNPQIQLNIYTTSKNSDKYISFKDCITYSGNVLFVVSSKFYNQELEGLRDSGRLVFGVTMPPDSTVKDYQIRVEVSRNYNILLGNNYSVLVDPTIFILNFNLLYNANDFPALRKLRFQLTAVRNEPEYKLAGHVTGPEGSYTLNNIFQKTVGGILAEPQLPICKRPDCSYALEVSLNNTKVFNLESFLIGQMEKLSIDHFEEYYDRVYTSNEKVFYELPYEESMAGMDVSISLITVTGLTGLYVNARSLPQDITKYDWRETGSLAKRITVSWDELVAMRAEKSSLYIAVSTETPGEFLLKIDAHEKGSRGRLNSGIVEAGFVQYNEINNYLYYFDVFETQDVNFDLHLTVTSGDANLYLKQCSSLSNCKIEQDSLTSTNIFKVEDSMATKALVNLPFKCVAEKSASSSCQFVIGVKGKENHGTHYELSLQESNFHRLLVPGHRVTLYLNEKEVKYFKFSKPSGVSGNLQLAIENLWGSFDVFVSRSELFPTAQKSTTSQSFKPQPGLVSVLSSINLADTEGSSLGPYYFSVNAVTACMLTMRIIERADSKITIHTLSTGAQIRGEIVQPTDIIYYTFRVSLESASSSAINVVLTPLKGSYLIFASRNGKLPSSTSAEFFSQNNQLELKTSKDKQPEEFIIGVRLSDTAQSQDTHSFQFLISVVNSSKPLKLTAGFISTFTISESNLFLIEVLPEMKTLLILKSVVDGFNIDMCAKFISTPEATGSDSINCDYSANEKAVSIYVPSSDLSDRCNKLKPKCYVLISIKAPLNQKFSIGFINDNHPFNLVKNLVLTCPLLLSATKPLHFVYHTEPDQPIALHFNAKGGQLAIYTKLRRLNELVDDVSFPNPASFDQENQIRRGYITDIFYPKERVQEFGSNPELLITVSAMGENVQAYEPLHNFVLQSSLESKEIMRTQSLSDTIRADAWQYYTFYNNGNTKHLNVYVTTNTHSKLTVVLSRGLQSRPPLTNRPLVEQMGFGSVELTMTLDDAKKEGEGKDLRDHFSVGVLSANQGTISLYWNNKDDLNFIELTPNEPSTMQLVKDKTLYFSLFSRDIDLLTEKKQNLIFYFQSTVQIQVYLIKAATGELDIPNAENAKWRASLSAAGGVAFIEIAANDPDYCLDCSFIGKIEHSQEGTFNILASFKHDSIPIQLTPGFTFPELLKRDSKSIYRLVNPDADLLDVSISMLNGYIEAYVSASADVSEEKYGEKYTLEGSFDTHKFIVIAPFKFNITEPHDFYLLLVNKRADSASFTIHLDKNSIRTPIVPGITRFFQLAMGESTTFSHMPAEGNSSFELRLELRQLLSPSTVLIAQALDLLETYMEVYHMSDRGDRYALRYKSKEKNRNILSISLDLSGTNDPNFVVHVYNPIASPVAISLDLLSGGYRLVNQNDIIVDKTTGNVPMIYEAFTQPDKYFFVDLKLCVGDVKVTFTSDDPYGKNLTDYKTVKDAHSFVHYIMPSSNKLFLTVENSQESFSAYQITFYTEDTGDGAQYNEISQGNAGKVSVEIESGVVSIAPIKIKSTFSNNFSHRVNYTVYLSDEYRVMRYAKTCGNFMLSNAFADIEPHVLSFSNSFYIKEAGDIEKFKEQVQIKFSGLNPNTKYHGAVVARIELYPAEMGYLTPIRVSNSYYDEFFFVTAKYDIPYNLVISTIVVCGFFFCLLCILKAIIFGKLRMRNLEKFSEMTFDEGVLGFKVMQILDKNDTEEEAAAISEEPHEPEPPQPQPVEMQDTKPAPT